MKTIEVTASHITLNGLRLQLSTAQFATRKHMLKVVNADQGIYDLLGETDFIKGEVLGIEGDISPVLALEVEIADADEEAGEVAPSGARVNPVGTRASRAVARAAAKAAAEGAGDDNDKYEGNDKQ